MTNKYIVLLAILSVSIFFFSCEKEKSDVVDPSLTTPFVVSAALQDSMLNLDTTSTTAVIRANGQFIITDSITVQVFDAVGPDDISQVSYKIYKPNSSFYFKSGPLNLVSTSGNTATYAQKISFTLKRFEAGVLRIETYASGRSNLTSNSLFTPLSITRNNSRPQIFNLIMPDTLVRPLHGSLPFKLSVSVNDSDGYNDILFVFFQQLLPKPTGNIQLYDDGNCCAIPILNNHTSGDNAANDGIFTITESIDSSNTPGDHRLFFQAMDNNGALSDSLFGTFTIVVQ